jgi:xanthine dehydrogenase iron-sulfur cluster and FAD-binding subunit A
MYGYAFVRDNANATRAEIEQGLKGVMCRCCAHSRMIDAIQSYAKERNPMKPKKPFKLDGAQPLPKKALDALNHMEPSRRDF